MAIFHLDVKSVSRGQGMSATAATAYRSGARIEDRRTGEVFDYTRRRGVEASALFLPPGAPEWDRQTLWNAAEAAENRKNSQVAREVIIALPHELSPEEREELAAEFSRWLVERHGVAVDMAVHAPHRQGDERNYHAHLLVSTRRLEAEGFTEKTRELDVKGTSSEHITTWRREWEGQVNRSLERAGKAERVDCRSHDERGDDREPLLHMGREATGMERRGEQSRIGEENRARKARNAERPREKKSVSGREPEPGGQREAPGPDKERITELWRQADSGAAFAVALEAEGLRLCQGDRRPFVILDAGGKAHGAARLIEGAKTADLRERLADVALPSVDAARQEMEQQRAALAERERETTRAAAQREATQLAAAKGQARQPHAPTGQQVSQWKAVARAQEAERQKQAQRASDEAQRKARAAETARRAEDAKRAESQAKAATPSPSQAAARTAEKTAGKGLHVAGAVAGKGAEKLTDFVAGIFEGLLGAPPQKPKTFTVAQLLTDPKAEKEHRLAQLAKRERDEALDHIAEDMKRGKNLDRTDVRKLGYDDLEGIRAHGDAHVEKLLREREEELKRSRERTRGR